jgi:lysophospholipase L1-like esterase
MMKRIQSIVSVILCITVLAGALGLAACKPNKAKTYLVLGDSIGVGAGIQNPEEACYGRIIADTNGYSYFNDAVNGHTSAKLLARLDEPDVLEHVMGADIISISIGGNNFLLGNLNGLLFDGIVKQDYARFDAIAAGFYDDLGTIVDNIRALNKDAAIVLQTIYNPQTDYVGEVYQAGADRLNATMRKYMQAHPGEILLADVAAALTDSDTDFAEDRIHPSAAGNEKIAKVVLQTLFDNGLGTKTEPVITTKGVDARGTGMFTVFVNLYGRFFHLLAVIRSLLHIG